MVARLGLHHGTSFALQRLVDPQIFLQTVSKSSRMDPPRSVVVLEKDRSCRLWPGQKKKSGRRQTGNGKGPSAGSCGGRMMRYEV